MISSALFIKHLLMFDTPGEEEEAHWKTVFESIHSRFSNKRGGGKFGGRGRGRGNKRRGEFSMSLVVIIH